MYPVKQNVVCESETSSLDEVHLHNFLCKNPARVERRIEKHCKLTKQMFMEHINYSDVRSCYQSLGTVKCG